jgi:hypothetical protein
MTDFLPDKEEGGFVPQRRTTCKLSGMDRIIDQNMKNVIAIKFSLRMARIDECGGIDAIKNE